MAMAGGNGSAPSAGRPPGEAPGGRKHGEPAGCVVAKAMGRPTGMVGHDAQVEAPQGTDVQYIAISNAERQQQLQQEDGELGDKELRALLQAQPGLTTKYVPGVVDIITASQRFADITFYRDIAELATSELHSMLSAGFRGAEQSPPPKQTAVKVLRALHDRPKVRCIQQLSQGLKMVQSTPAKDAISPVGDQQVYVREGIRTRQPSHAATVTASENERAHTTAHDTHTPTAMHDTRQTAQFTGAAQADVPQSAAADGLEEQDNRAASENGAVGKVNPDQAVSDIAVMENAEKQDDDGETIGGADNAQDCTRQDTAHMLNTVQAVIESNSKQQMLTTKVMLANLTIRVPISPVSPFHPPLAYEMEYL